MRAFNLQKIPRPPFDYIAFARWKNRAMLPISSNPTAPTDKNDTPNINQTVLPTDVDRDGPFAIEIGCGAGLHPIRWAQNNPNGKILAIERTTGKFRKFVQRIAHHPHLENIFPAQADAFQLLPFLVSQSPKEVDEIFILYPNPYPKGAHKNLRFAFSPFTVWLSQILKPGGTITFATNISSYAQELKTYLSQITDLTLDSYHEITGFEKPFTPRSHFEKKYLDRGETCFNLVFRRKKPKAVAHKP